VSVVRVLVQGDEIIVDTDGASRKARNLAVDPSIILSIEDTERSGRGYQRHLVIRGTARIEPTLPVATVDALCRKYVGLDRHPLRLRNSPTAATIRVQIQRISELGPWSREPAATVAATSPG